MSPFLPQQHHYNASNPSTSYHAFATQAGCPTPHKPTLNNKNNKTSQSLFDCLISKPTSALQAASNLVSKSGRYGTWAFQPVTDSTFISSAPSAALKAGRINGATMLTSNAAEESFAYVPQNITTKPSFFTWLESELPLFTTANISSLLTLYPLPLLSNSSHTRFATPGTAQDKNNTALSTSATASGLQQLANLIHAERTFICPSYWLAESFSAHSRGGRGWKLQFSIPVAVHAVDEQLVFGNRLLPSQGEEVVGWVQRLWGGFVGSGDPRLLRMGEGKVVGNWTPYTFGHPVMLNVNQTGGTRQPVDASLSPFLQGVDADWYIGPGLRGKLEVVDGETWEGGRGKRCEFWREVGA
jgi:carboxylesterase type B